MVSGLGSGPCKMQKGEDGGIMFELGEIATGKVLRYSFLWRWNDLTRIVIPNNNYDLHSRIIELSQDP